MPLVSEQVTAPALDDDPVASVTMMLSPAATPTVVPLLGIVMLVTKPEPWLAVPKLPTKPATAGTFGAKSRRRGARVGAVWTCRAPARPASTAGRACAGATGGASSDAIDTTARATRTVACLPYLTAFVSLRAVRLRIKTVGIGYLTLV